MPDHYTADRTILSGGPVPWWLHTGNTAPSFHRDHRVETQSRFHCPHPLVDFSLVIRARGGSAYSELVRKIVRIGVENARSYLVIRRYLEQIVILKQLAGTSADVVVRLGSKCPT